MPMKEWLYRYQPLQLYFMLALTSFYVLVQFFMSHITHSLTLLVSTYHMLCNIIALTGCMITIKHNNKPHPDKVEIIQSVQHSTKKAKSNAIEVSIPSSLDGPQHQQHHHHAHTALRNTFGWIRIDVLTMLIVCIFMASLCFSLVIQAIQTLFHMDQQDTIHHPMIVLGLAVIGLLLNGLCYLMIGGYTYHQGSFLHINSTGNVVLDRVVTTKNSISIADSGEIRLNAPESGKVLEEGTDSKRSRDNYLLDISRDLCSK